MPWMRFTASDTSTPARPPDYCLPLQPSIDLKPAFSLGLRCQAVPAFRLRAKLQFRLKYKMVVGNSGNSTRVHSLAQLPWLCVQHPTMTNGVGGLYSC